MKTLISEIREILGMPFDALNHLQSAEVTALHQALTEQQAVPQENEATASAVATITGAEFRDFYQNHWPGEPGEVWHEDAEYEIEDDAGNFVLADSAVLELRRLGYVQFENGKFFRTFEDVWNEWKQQDHPLMVTCRIEPGNLHAFLRAARQAGAEVINEAALTTGTEVLKADAERGYGK